MTASSTGFDVVAARRSLDDLRQLEREIVELSEVRRSDALERIRDALRRIGEVTSPQGILDRAADELGASSSFDRVLISHVRERRLVPHELWIRDDPAHATAVLAQLASASIPLEYPLVEQEVAKRQDAAIVDVPAAGSRSPRQLSEALSWTSYVVVALTLRGTTVGLLHADASHGGRTLGPLDRDVASLYAEGLAGAFECAALRQILRRHREELGTAVRWMSGRLDRLAATGDVASPRDAPERSTARTDSLTPREAEVMRLLIGGHTNRTIAATLVISEGTAKYHVKNVLRKLNAASRAEAVAHYLGDRRDRGT